MEKRRNVIAASAVGIPTWLRVERFQFENYYFTEMCSGSEAGAYLRLMDFCITQL